MKALLGVLLAVSVLGNIFMLLTEKTSQPAATGIPEPAVTRIREIAELCGGDAERLRRQDGYETLSEIRDALRDAQMTAPAVLGKAELELLDNYLDNKPEVLAKIKRQNAFAGSLRGKRLLILPEER